MERQKTIFSYKQTKHETIQIVIFRFYHTSANQGKIMLSF